jgi:hypothetical protein
MSRLTLTFLFIVLCIATAGCTAPVPLQEPGSGGTGSLHVSSQPHGAEVWLDGEFRATTPCALSGITPGHHAVEVRMSGYETVTYPVTVVEGGLEGVSATLVSTNTILPVTVVTTTTPQGDFPQIRVDGYWTYPQGRDTTTNPVALIVHTEAFNVGTKDAREVMVSANIYNGGRMVCWNTVFLGTLTAGSHVSRDSMVTCTLPSPRSDADLVVRFGNLVVTE